MNYKLYVFHDDPYTHNHITCWFVVNNEKVCRYNSPTTWKEYEGHFRESRFYDEYKPFAEFSNRKDLFDVMYYLTTSNKNSKRYKKIIENKKLYEYLI